MKKSKKWLAVGLICSQLLSTLPVAAAVDSSTIGVVIKEEQTSSAASENNEDEETVLTPEENQPEGTVPEEQPESEPETVPEEVEKTPEEQPEEQPDNGTSDPSQPETTPENNENNGTGTTDSNGQTQGNTSSGNTSSSPATNYNRQETPAVVQPDKEQENNFVVTPDVDTWTFIREIGEAARKVGEETDLYASVMIAQAILESGGGKSQLSQEPYYNLFGIKGTYEGNGVVFKTQEDDGTGNLFTIESTFRKYESHEESFEDYAKLLKEGLTHDADFYKGTWKSETEDYKEATEFLTGRYATDIHYGKKLNALIEAYALERYDQPKAELPEGSEEFILPLEGGVISSPFGPRGDGFHRGVDFAAPAGTPIVAVQAGKVIRSEYHPSWGNYVAVVHESGLTTLYAHNSQNAVSVGDLVEQGELLGLVGSTGNSTGPHLHFEVSLSEALTQDQLIDPMILFQ